MKTILLLFSLFCATILPSLSATPPYTDPFSFAEQPGRRATRGPWSFEGGGATCVQDDALSFPVTHPAIAQPKIVVGLGFAFGTMQLKNFSVE